MLSSLFNTTTPTPTLGTPIALWAPDTAELLLVVSEPALLSAAVPFNRDELRLAPLDDIVLFFPSNFFLFASIGGSEIGSDGRFPFFSTGRFAPMSSLVYNARSISAALYSARQPRMGSILTIFQSFDHLVDFVDKDLTSLEIIF